MLYYHFIPPQLPFLSIYAASWRVRLDAILSFSLLQDFFRSVRIKCELCNLSFWATKCPACWRGLSSELSDHEEKPQLLAEMTDLEAVLMDVEQRGCLLITVFRNGGKVVRLLPPRARALMK